MLRRPLGSTGLSVSVIGLGTGALGTLEREEDAAALLGSALDEGVNLLDTAPSYGPAEERIGRALRARRAEVVLCGKCGYGVPGLEDWTGPCITLGIDRILRRLNTDVIEVMQLHSCPVEVLERPGVLDALAAAVKAGKVRAAGYSGENAALEHAVKSGAFAVVQASVNLFDQGSLDGALAAAARAGMGILAKRPLGNAPWRFTDRPSAHDTGAYWDRMKALGLEAGAMAWEELAIRFAAFAPGVSACLLGTTRVDHLRSAIRAVEAGPLPNDTVESLRATFRGAGAGWDGII